MPRRTRKQQQSRKQKKGGSTSATDYGQRVFGEPGQQQMDPTTHAIQMNQVRGGTGNASMEKDLMATNALGNNFPTSLRGGKQRKGGKILTDVALPAVLVLANQTFGKRRSQSKYRTQSRRRRSSRRFRRSMRR
jgi:hypothetical protein